MVVVLVVVRGATERESKVGKGQGWASVVLTPVTRNTFLYKP